MNNKTSELQIENTSETEIVNVNLFNYLGQIVLSWDSNLNQTVNYLPVNQPTGMYILKINTLDGIVTKKIIIE